MLLQIKFKIYHQSAIQPLMNTQAPFKSSKFRVKDEQNDHTSRAMSLGLKPYKS